MYQSKESVVDDLTASVVFLGFNKFNSHRLYSIAVLGISL